MLAATAGMEYRAKKEAGMAAKQEGEFTAKAIEEQAKFRKLQAIQEHNQIMENFQSYKNENAALTGIMGRDEGSDRSLKALREKANKNTIVAAKRQNLQTLAELSKFSQQRNMTLMKANNIQKAYNLSAFSSILSAGYKASQVYVAPTNDPSKDGIYT